MKDATTVRVLSEDYAAWVSNARRLGRLIVQSSPITEHGRDAYAVTFTVDWAADGTWTR